MYLEVIGSKKDVLAIKSGGTHDIVTLGRLLAGLERRNIGANLEVAEDRPNSATVYIHSSDLIKIIAE
jgi:hypothetical protein